MARHYVSLSHLESQRRHFHFKLSEISADIEYLMDLQVALSGRLHVLFLHQQNSAVRMRNVEFRIECRELAANLKRCKRKRKSFEKDLSDYRIAFTVCCQLIQAWDEANSAREIRRITRSVYGNYCDFDEEEDHQEDSFVTSDIEIDSESYGIYKRMCLEEAAGAY